MKIDTTEMRMLLSLFCWALSVHTIYAFPKQLKNSPVENMNGEYLIANPNDNGDNRFSTQYSKYPNVEFFDVYTPPISTR